VHLKELENVYLNHRVGRGLFRNALCQSVTQWGSQSVTCLVRTITYVCIDGLPSNLVQMLSSLRRCAVTLTRIHTSKVKVTHNI